MRLGEGSASTEASHLETVPLGASVCVLQGWGGVGWGWGGDGNCSLGTAIQSWEGWRGGGSPIAFITVPVGETAGGRWHVQVARGKLCMEWGLVGVQ